MTESSELARDLAEKFYISIVRRARKLLRDDEAAKDVAQEVLIRVITSGPSNRGAPPHAWVGRVTTNLCLNWIRNRKRQRELLETFQTRPEECILSDQSALASELLQQVPEGMRDIFNYYYGEELTHDQIAARLGVSRRTIGNRLSELTQLVRARVGAP